MVLLGTGPRPLWVQRAEGGVELGAPSGGHLLIAVAFHGVEGGLSGIPDANFHVPSSSATSEVAVFKKVKHGFTTSGKSPVVTFSLLIALCSRNLYGTLENIFREIGINV